MAGVIERRGGSRAAPRHRKGRAVLRPPSRDSVPPVLPTPPLDGEKFSYVRRHIWVLTLFSALSFPPLVYSQIRMVENSQWFILYAPFAVFGIFCFLLSLIVDGMSRSFDLDEHKQIVAAWAPRRYPSVDIFLPVCGEPIEVLHNAWSHVAVLRNHYPGRVTPYVLDDSASPALKAMARHFGFAYATRPDRGWLRRPAICASASRSLRASTSCCSTPTSHRARIFSTRPCHTSTCFPT